VDLVLKKLGWNPFFGRSFKEYAASYEPGRISNVNKSGCKAYTKSGEIRARISGRQRQNGIYPAIGDWVALSKDSSGTNTIHAILSLAV